jgi:hypothetical protein
LPSPICTCPAAGKPMDVSGSDGVTILQRSRRIGSRRRFGRSGASARRSFLGDGYAKRFADLNAILPTGKK